MLAPHVAEDVDILQRHISQHKTSEGEDPASYQTVSHDTRNPSVFLSVPRYRTGLRPEIGAGKEQLEIIEHIMGPFKREVIELYFQHLYHHFPILGDETCHMVRHTPEKAPKNLMCILYANGMLNWRSSDTLKLHPRPDTYYVWNKAISAVIEDFFSPSLTTCSAAVLDQTGRPSVSIVNNVTLCGRNISLAQTFGLHRDPSRWDMPDHEKQSRIRVWWGVLITDYWSSIAYGAPPHIAKGYYDVPIPTLDSLLCGLGKVTVGQKCAFTCFINLCALTELLGDILPLVHGLRVDPNELYRSVEQKKIELEDLGTRIPEWLPHPNRPGSSNLWFFFLSIKLVLSRVALRAAVLLGDVNLEKKRLEELRAASSAVLDFVLNLGEAHFQDFWLPYVTHMLVMAIMVSLRCTVEAHDPEIRMTSFARLQSVMDHIQHAFDNYDWDIAGYCLERCQSAVTKISSYAMRDHRPSPPPPAVVHIPQVPVSGDIPQMGMAPVAPMDDQQFELSDFFDPNLVDFSWEALWDTTTGVNFTI